MSVHPEILSDNVSVALEPAKQYADFAYRGKLNAASECIKLLGIQPDDNTQKANLIAYMQDLLDNDRSPENVISSICERNGGKLPETFTQLIQALEEPSHPFEQ